MTQHTPYKPFCTKARSHYARLDARLPAHQHPECGCALIRQDNGDVSLYHCSLHAHAHQMKDWLTAALIRLGDEPDFATAYALLATIQKGG